MNIYEYAKQEYAKIGIDTDAAIKAVSELILSVHCWQGDDVGGFDSDTGVSGGIQATGNYPGKARTPEELMADFDKAISLCPGKKKLNLHACYAIFEDGEYADRDAIEPKHFAKWVEFAKARGMGIDFNPTFFAHPKASGLTLTSPDEEIRAFWVRHGKACVKISEYFARETGVPCVMNIWIPDGFKEIPADRMGPRRRYMQSLDEILSVKESSDVYVTLESKVFGIGLESCTAGSGEFCLGYSISRGIVPLMDNGHYHPTEDVSDKISALLLFSDKIAFHLTRSVRWDSDHVVRFNDEMRSIANEVVASGRVDDIFLALDFFDASINRVAAWVNGIRNAQKSLLYAFLTPHAKLTEYQDAGNFTRVLSESEELKTMPFGAVWNEFCRMAGVPADGEWMSVVEEYEKEVLLNR